VTHLCTPHPGGVLDASGRPLPAFSTTWAIGNGSPGAFEEIEAAGYKAIVLTVDTGVQSRRDLHMEALYMANGGQAPLPRPVTPGNEPAYLSMVTRDYVRFLRTLILPSACRRGGR
jgi:hypothetical protein